jgi:hypothetical protein
MLERIQQKWVPVLGQKSLPTHKSGALSSRELAATSLETTRYIDERC